MNIISLLKPRDVEQMGGIPENAICGKFEGEIMEPEYFKANEGFVDMMHAIIGTKGQNIRSLQEAAKKQQTGNVFVIDLRTPEGVMGEVPPEDIIGAFKIQDGKIVKNSYERNNKHKIFTKNGLVELPQELYKIVVDELKKI
jgi:rhodanese-related sulfurtransferase